MTEGPPVEPTQPPKEDIEEVTDIVFERMVEKAGKVLGRVLPEPGAPAANPSPGVTLDSEVVPVLKAFNNSMLLMIQSFGEGFQHLNNQVMALTRSNDQLRKALKRLSPKIAEDIERMEDEEKARVAVEAVEKTEETLQPSPPRNGFRVKKS
jgi:hypothetical protein